MYPANGIFTSLVKIEIQMVKNRILSAAVTLATLAVSTPAIPGEWEWNISENSAAIGFADEGWTVDIWTADKPKYQGEKLLLDGHYVIKRSSSETETPGIGREDLKFVLDADLQWNFDASEFDVAKLTFTPWATEWEHERETKRGFRVTRDQLEWAALQFGYDDPLGVDSYSELTAVRGGRTWSYTRTDDSDFRFYFGAKVSLGWAWAESVNPLYEVSNPFAGFGMTLGVEHEKFGLLYADNRVVSGLTLGSPTGETTSREARIRFGYMKKFYKCMTVDVFFEKRSFDFLDSELPDFYRKAKRFGAELSCKFENT